MGTHFDGLQKAQFGGIFFPIEDLSFSSTQRHVLHEYPHTPGSNLEKLGRRSYVIKITPIFDETIASYDGLNGIPLYPQALERLQFLYEEETTSALTIPTLGSIDAFMTSFSRRMAPNLRSGERVEIEFVEDQSKTFSFEATEDLSGKRLAAKAKELLKLVAEAEKITGPRPALVFSEKRVEDNIFDKIDKAVNSVLAIQDQADLSASLVTSKIEKLTGYLSEADRRIKRLQHPESYPMLEALKELWAASVDLKKTATFESFRPLHYRVMHGDLTIQDVSRAIFGTTAKSMELLQMNDIDEPSNIRIGTIIKYMRSAT